MLHRPDFLPPANTSDINFSKVEMQKFKRKKIYTEDKYIHFLWMVGLITTEGEKVTWVVGGAGPSSQHEG